MEDWGEEVGVKWKKWTRLDTSGGWTALSSESWRAVVPYGNACHVYVHIVGPSKRNGFYLFLILSQIQENEPICQNETTNFGPSGSYGGWTFNDGHKY